jgi:hypothetical protein
MMLHRRDREEEQDDDEGSVSGGDDDLDEDEYKSLEDPYDDELFLDEEDRQQYASFGPIRFWILCELCI